MYRPDHIGGIVVSLRDACLVTSTTHCFKYYSLVAHVERQLIVLTTMPAINLRPEAESLSTADVLIRYGYYSTVVVLSE